MLSGKDRSCLGAGVLVAADSHLETTPNVEDDRHLARPMRLVDELEEERVLMTMSKVLHLCGLRGAVIVQPGKRARRGVPVQCGGRLSTPARSSLATPGHFTGKRRARHRTD